MTCGCPADSVDDVLDAQRFSLSQAEAQDGRGVGDRPKLHVLIAQDLREEVEAANWPVGEVLGSEAALAQRYRVSRSIMREAVRLLEHQQVALMMRGPSGGLTVREPSADAVAHAIAVVFDYRGVSLGELLHIKTVIEMWCVRSVVERVSPAGLVILENEAKEETTPLGEAFLAYRQDSFHAAIAEQSGNPVAAMFLAAITALVVRYTPTALRHDTAPAKTRSGIGHAHSVIMEAIRARDADLAARRMEKHLAGMSDWLRASHGERAIWTDVDVQRAATRIGDDKAKLAEIVAERIRDDVLAAGWKVGSTLGTEPTLLDRYSVSRSVFREAVRLLEYHSVVAYRPGNRGGLVVAEPTNHAAVRAALSYLRYRAVSQQDLSEMRLLLERQAAVLAASRSAADTSVLARYLALPNGNSHVQCVAPFHLSLAEVSDNRALALLVDVLVQLQEYMRPDANESAITTADNDTLAAHSSVLEAVVGGDAERAAELIEAHLAPRR